MPCSLSVAALSGMSFREEEVGGRCCQCLGGNTTHVQGCRQEGVSGRRHDNPRCAGAQVPLTSSLTSDQWEAATRLQRSSWGRGSKDHVSRVLKSTNQVRGSVRTRQSCPTLLTPSDLGTVPGDPVNHLTASASGTKNSSDAEVHICRNLERLSIVPQNRFASGAQARNDDLRNMPSGRRRPTSTKAEL